ncbi:YadA-like family protein [Methylobacterium sp. Leaf87]|uniref:YadA-like family protein n=1 Tax=Methylobacterium sp. Leaf87 TaxID=1736243 RepID=UPI000AB8F387|nr:YadA-like family protein [Methylobacterium sp. Leaf87]
MRICVALALGALPLPAMAQGLTFADPVAIFGPSPIGYPFTVPGGTPVSSVQSYIAVLPMGTGQYNGYISTNDLIAASSEASNVTGQVNANSAALVAIANRLDRFADRFREGIALAGAINVLPPNPGDRFAVSFGGAGYDGTGAGSVAISARINESTLAYIGYARGPTQNLVKGGVGFSFR